MAVRKNILLASANVNTNKGFLEELRTELEGVKTALKDGIERGLVHVMPEESVCTFESLFRKFNQYDSRSINIFHFCGHSDAEQVCFHNDGAGNKQISNQHLVNFLKHQEGLEVVFLNSCCSETLGELILTECQSVKVVIETTTSVGDSQAAKFAKKIYEGLNSGKSLKSAFDQALSYFEGALGQSFQRKENARDIIGFEPPNEGSQSVWKISFEDISFIENWFLIERAHQKFYAPEVTTRVLAIYEDSGANEKYYRLVRNLFLTEPQVLVYALTDILLESDKEALIGDTDIAVVVLSEGLSGYWNQFDWLRPLLKDTPMFFLGCDGDVQQSSDLIESQLLKKNVPIFPSPPFTLAQLSLIQNLEVAFNKFCAEHICREIINPFSRAKEVLSEELDNLNFGSQRKPFETKDDSSFQFGKYNLVLVEGSPYCAQELLVKKLLSYANPRIDSNIRRHVISIRNNIPNAITQQEIRQLLAYTLLEGVKVDLGMEALTATLAQKTEQQDLVIILNDVAQNNGNCLPELRSFWNELTAGLPISSNYPRLFLFVIHKECQGGVNQWNIQGFRSEPPMFNVRVLDVIEPLNEQALNTWHAHTGKRFSHGHIFHSLIQEEKTIQILSDPYMSKAIAQICHLMRCPEVSSSVLTI